MLQAITLNTNKQTTNLSRVELRDSDKGEILETFILNPDGTPYDLTGKSLIFNENKDGEKFLSDANVTIANDKIGYITYQLHDQAHSASGTAWFDIIDKSNGAKIDSTTDFYIEVRDGLKCSVYNTTYIAALEKLKRQMEAMIKEADEELKAELQKAERLLNQELEDFRRQYNALSTDFQNQFKEAQNQRQQDYNNQKNAINADWGTTKDDIRAQSRAQNAIIQKKANETIDAIKSDAKQVLDKDQADWNAKQSSWDDTFSRIVKEWQVKVSTLDSTALDLSVKFNSILTDLNLNKEKIAELNKQIDEAQNKVKTMQNSLSNVNWDEFARKKDLIGENLLPDTFTLKGYSDDKPGSHSNIYSDIDYSGSMNDTAKIQIVARSLNDLELKIPQVQLPAGTYTLSFKASMDFGDNSMAGFPDILIGLCSTYYWGIDNKGNLAKISPVGLNNYQITFTLSGLYVINDLCLRFCGINESFSKDIYLYLCNLKLEKGSIATRWWPSLKEYKELAYDVTRIKNRLNM